MITVGVIKVKLIAMVATLIVLRKSCSICSVCLWEYNCSKKKMLERRKTSGNQSFNIKLTFYKKLSEDFSKICYDVGRGKNKIRWMMPMMNLNQVVEDTIKK